jgi:hypothetical protein
MNEGSGGPAALLTPDLLNRRITGGPGRKAGKVNRLP